MKSLGLAAVACALLASTTASAQTSGAPDPAALRTIEAQVVQIRGLQALSEPDLQFLDHEALHTFLVDEFERNYLPSEREADQKELVALGLIQPTDDLMQIQLNLLSQQVVGVYDSDAKALFVLSDAGAFGPGERVTFAHEFDHALQDQHFDLKSVAPKHPDSNDRSLAAHAVIEGDAILVQTKWTQQNLSRDELLQLARDAASADDGLAQAPLIVRTELLFPYVDGYSFVRRMYREAGNTFVAVDALLRDPPESTAQLLHPEKYRGHVHPVEVDLPDLAARLGPDWRKVGSGVLGELDTRVLLEQWGSSHADAARIASGWSGDRWQLVERDGRVAVVVKSTWESPGAASEFFGAYAAGLRQRFGSAQVELSTDTRQALTTPDAATDLRLQGSDVLAVIGFDRDSAGTIADAVTASFCSAASSAP